MSTPERQRGPRLLAGVHLGQAVLLLAQPSGGAVRSITGHYGAPPAGIVRVLGARLVIQAASEAIHPSLRLLRLGVLVDLAHAASMLAAARRWSRYRRAALASAGSAAASALAGTLIVWGQR